MLLGKAYASSKQLMKRVTSKKRSYTLIHTSNRKCGLKTHLTPRKEKHALGMHNKYIYTHRLLLTFYTLVHSCELA